MGGGGAIVHGFRRWFYRRNGSTSGSNQSSVAGEGDDGSSDLEVIEDPDLVALRAIRVPKRKMPLPVESHRKNSVEMEFFTEYGEASQYQIQEVIGKGSYGVVAAAVDTHTGERVAIKKINDVFEHVSDATRILREIKLLRLLRHPDIVEIKHIMLPPSRREFQDIYVVFELMESDLHQVIKANDDLTPEHHQFFLYQLLRALKYTHAANVFHRDLKPKNILANSDCKLKICDFGLARASFNDAPSAIFWTDYVATRWYRAPELCGSFFSKYTPAIDIWSIGCIFAELLTGRPLFPGKNVVHQLDLITDLLGTPSSETLSRIRNEKARRYLSSMRKKYPVPFTHKFRNADPLALRLLERLLAFDPKDRPTAEEALADPYFASLANVEREPSRHPISKLEFEFERRELAKDDVRELIYREILEYHPQMLEEYMKGGEQISFLYPSGVDRFKRQFAHLEEIRSKIQTMEESRYFSFDKLEKITEQFAKERELGRGGYGVVYKGIQHDGEVIAVKRLHSKLQGITDAAFDNEILNLRNVDHPNVVRVIGYCHEARHQFFTREGKPMHAYGIERLLCFEYVEGRSLDKYISDELCNLDWPTCYRIIRGTCEGLNHLHAQGQPIYHRDLKPANILLDRNMMPKIADLGLSKIVASTDTYKTESQLKGTPAYMPPEFAKSGHVSPMFDVFSLGVIIIRIMDGNEGNSRRFEMPRQQFINRVTKNWKERMQGTSRSSQEKYIQQVNMCVDITLSCVENDRRSRPRVHDIVKKMKALEDEFGELSSKIGELSSKIEELSLKIHKDPTLQGEMSPTLSIIEVPTSSSLGTMGPLLWKLDLLLDSENQLIKRSAKVVINLLKEDLEEIRADLAELSMLERSSYKARYWMQEVRELSYHIEDCIDNMMQSRAAAAEAKVRFSGRRPQLRVHRRVKIPWLPKTVQPSARIAELRTLLWEARERHERYQLQDCISEPRFLFSWNSRAPAPPLLSGAGANLVGVDGTRRKLTSWLNDQTEEEQQQLKVLSILGPTGVGKTTLAKALYSELGKQFECQAFVRISRNPDMKMVLREILSQVQGCKQDYEYDATSTADNLMYSIRSHLQDKRYFVVIDELWDAAVWDIMNNAFPNSNNCSRIIITAEGKDVASKCYCVNKLEMAPLGNLQDSGKIFFDRVFGSEHQCPDQLKDISCMIIRSCGGFPLAITTIASLLASQIEKTELWDYLQKCFVSRLTGVTLEETCKEVVKICYDALPEDLKTCLLYLTMYPEGFTIRKADLLNQWIAEGFITPAEGKQAVAENYFAELINRRMIQPEKIGHDDEVLSCTVHHIVFDLIAQKCREENFITAVDYSQAMPGFSMIARRLSLHFSCAQFAAKPEGLKLSQVRSLAFYGVLKCMPSITEFKFLRVLILEFWGNNYHHNTSLDLSKLSILFHLRYLKVSSHTVIVLPFKIQRLQSLETLEIDAKVSAVPTDILHLPGLLHLRLPNGTELPNGIGRITSLETLEHFDLGSNSEDNAQSLGELINLHNLHVTCSKAVPDHHLKRNLVALSSSIGKLANLKSLRVGPFAVSMTMFIDQDDMPCTPKLLQRIELLPSSCIFSRLPTWIGGLEELRILKIAVRVLLSSDIDTLTGLPVLAVLSLYVQKPNAESVVFNSGALPVLKYFKYRCAALRLGFQKEALPNLQRLKLCFNVHRAESYTSNLAGIENLLKLKEITAEIGAATGAHESDRRAAESALKEATRKHPRFPIHMNVKSVDCIEEESTPARFMHRIPCILGFLALAVVVVVLIMLFWY